MKLSRHLGWHTARPKSEGQIYGPIQKIAVQVVIRLVAETDCGYDAGVRVGKPHSVIVL